MSWDETMLWTVLIGRAWTYLKYCSAAETRLFVCWRSQLYGVQFSDDDVDVVDQQTEELSNSASWLEL